MREMTTDKSETKKDETVIHIESSSLKEKFVIDVVNLNYFISTTHRYLFTMVDFFKIWSN